MEVADMEVDVISRGEEREREEAQRNQRGERTQRHEQGNEVPEEAGGFP